MSINSISNNYSCSFENFEFPNFSDFLLAANDTDDEPYPDFKLFGESIHHDCKILESNSWTASSLTPGEQFEAICNENDSEKYEIRNHDCMWSGRCKTDYEKNKLAAKNQQQQTKSTIVVAAQTVESIKQQQPTTIAVPPATIQTATIQQILPPQQSKSAIQNIPPGTSLLINSRTKQIQQQEQQRRQQQQQQQQLRGYQSQCKVTIPTVMTNDFLKDRMIQIRPDSPLSLDDDPPEFKHSVDLSACIMGSNNICLDTTTTSLSSSLLHQQQSNNDIEKLLRIRMLREQLEDTSGKMIFNDNGKITGDISDVPTDLADVLNVLKAEIDDKSDDMMDSDSGESMASSNDEEEEEDEEEEYHSKSHSPSSGYGSNSPEYTSSAIHHSDHSYTRSKNGVDLSVLGLETPSDSDEEIDVVSVGDKKLPTNPSDKDRRALQTKVANRITARIVKTPAGIKTIPPRRRCSLEPYGSTTLSPAKSPLSSSYYNSSSSASSTTSNKYSTTSSRKRHYISSNSKDDYVPSNKRSRGSKKQRSSGNKRHSVNNNSSSSSTGNSHSNSNTNNCNYDPDEADTIEKRNLHNDMERQRRIGLKNLFEALKRQIPSIKDKERAPKVNILREAAKLCEQFTREEKQMNAMKQQLQRRQAQLRSLKQQAPQRAGGGGGGGGKSLA